MDSPVNRILVQSTLFSIGLHTLLLVPWGLKLGATTVAFTDVIRGESSVDLELADWVDLKEESGEEAPPDGGTFLDRNLEEEVKQELWENDGGAATRIFPSSLRNPAPHYPRQARIRGWQGTVLVGVFVTPAGGAGSVRVARSSGFPLLDDAALSALRQWRFTPARRGEQVVASRVEIPISFRLQEPGEEPSLNNGRSQ